MSAEKQLQKEIEKLNAQNKQQEELINTLLTIQLHSSIRIERLESWAEKTLTFQRSFVPSVSCKTINISGKLRQEEVARYNLDDEKDTLDSDPQREKLRMIVGVSLQSPCQQDRPKPPPPLQVKKIKAILPKFLRI